MRVLFLVALVSSAFALTACLGSSSDDAARAGSRVLQNSDSVVDDFGRSADDFGRQADAGSQQLNRLAVEDLEASATRLSEGTGANFSESREISCTLVRLYEEEGSAKPFVSWAIGKMKVPVARRFQVEEAMEDLGDAISNAEARDGLGALVSAACIG